MSRPRKANPAYQFHVSGQAKVRIAGKDFYLGKHGTPESYARYHALLAEYNAGGRKLPEELPQHQAEASITVSCVTADYLAEVIPLTKNPGDVRWQKQLLGIIDAKFGGIDADDFGPRKLTTVRQALIDRDHSRTFINKEIRFAVRVFEHGVARELVDASTIVALKCLKPLKRGQAREGKKVGPADLDDVIATLPHCCAEVAAMIRVQLGTGMRPTELFSMTRGEIDRSGGVFMYRPSEHKTVEHGVVKAVPLVGDALEAIGPYLFGEDDELVFVTAKGTPWNKDSYRRHIARACQLAGVHWTPRQLRHNVATAIADGVGLDGARAVLGHTSIGMTERYVHQKQDEAKAIEAAQFAPKLKANA